MDTKQISDFVNSFWDENITPTLMEYIEVPNKSPVFDPDWEANGHMEKALQMAISWLEKHPIPGSFLHIGRIKGRTPMLVMEVPGTIDSPDRMPTVLLYGHLDKQPEMEGWREGLGPWKAVMEEEKLYGRGGGDDGYALFASICAIKAIQEQGIPHARFVITIEFSEESGSPDLPAYMEEFEDIIGIPELVICLDSGAGNYDQLWSTTSLRGMIGGTLKVEVLQEGVHSGMGSGIIPSSFRIVRQLLSRIENEKTGQILLDELYVQIPPQRLEQAKKSASVLGKTVHSDYTFPEGMVPVDPDPVELLLNSTWRPALAIVGQEGIPSLQLGGNVLRPYTTLKWSLRLPPNLPAASARIALQRALTEDPPYGAKVTLDFEVDGEGWEAGELAPWLEQSLDEASHTFFGKEAMYFGLGGSIPFMCMLGEKYPEAQFVITGVLGPKSNAHGPNEFIHIPYAKKLTASIAYLLGRHGLLE
ncbi:MAG: M20/M25/M40 family metallo-hydrolase [SAR324 cluster bacterium]|nr:M20/M25/M40 family metallo-hydrolase [SAR324 cluster bacterium]